MFQNFLSDSSFRDHNDNFFRTSQAVRPGTDDWVEHQIHNSFEMNEPLEPYLWSILPHTLSLCRSAFLRSTHGSQ